MISLLRVIQTPIKGKPSASWGCSRDDHHFYTCLFLYQKLYSKTVALHLSSAYSYQILYVTFGMPCQKLMLGVQKFW